jgi:hypothetical protein
MRNYQTNSTERMLAQGHRWSEPTDNRDEQAITNAARFLNVERPAQPAEKLANLQHLLSGIAAN